MTTVKEILAVQFNECDLRPYGTKYKKSKNK